jgi:hypothetical protein
VELHCGWLWAEMPFGLINRKMAKKIGHKEEDFIEGIRDEQSRGSKWPIINLFHLHFYDCFNGK